MALQYMIKNAVTLFQRELHYDILVTDIQQIMFGQKWTVTGQILALVVHCILPFASQKKLCELV